eukprot:TRINITY_DN12533_c0_g1_i1.p1 TRINITY_DN12533_c0_g1~~TRINITY_DN12533_c0_g1_i1.p1  ORF type:complete len:566 (+),score=171.88 TRINITY_DN12533_c0_g1_i1:121-1818(+)
MADKYKQAQEALRRASRGGAVGGKSHGMDDTYWQVLNPKEWILGGHNVVWRKDTRRFLTEVHDSGTDLSGVSRWKMLFQLIGDFFAWRDRPLPSGPKILSQVPLAAVENVVRKYQPVSAKQHGVLAGALARVPVPFVREVVLLRTQHILYTREAREQHARVRRWCESMRDLADKEEAYNTRNVQKMLKGEEKEKKPKGVAKGQSKANAKERKPEETKNAGPIPQSRAVQQGSKKFEVVPREVFFQTLVTGSRHRTPRDLLRVFGYVALFVVMASFALFGGDSERTLYLRLLAWAGWQRLTGGDHGKAALAAHLANYLHPCWTEAETQAPPLPQGVPEALVELRHQRLYAKVLQVWNSTGHHVTVVPMPPWAEEAYYWRAGEILRRCDAVGIPQYSAGTKARDMHEILFFPRNRLTLELLGVNDRFVPVFHGEGKAPEVFGSSYRPWWPVLLDLLDQYIPYFRRESACECATAVEARGMTVPNVGTVLHPGCTRTLLQELAKHGYTRATQLTELQIFNAERGADAVHAVYPALCPGEPEADTYPPPVPLVLTEPGVVCVAAEASEA